MASNFFAPRSSKPKEKLMGNKDENYDKGRKRSFIGAWSKEFEWVQCLKLRDVYADNYEKIHNYLTELRKERSSNYSSADEVADDVICWWCRDHHYAKNKLDPQYVPSKRDLKERPFIFGSVSFRNDSLKNHC